MKKNILIVVFLCFVPFLHAQKGFRPKIGIGGHYGLSYGNVRFDPTIRSTPVEMYNYGLIFYYISERYLGIQLEANISQRGWQSGSDTTFYNIRKMTYAEFPLLTNITVGSKHLRFNINAGPYLAFFRKSFEGFDVGASETETVHTVSISTYEVQEQYTSKPEKNLDYGFTLGIGIGFHSILGDLTLRARYTQGLTNLFPQYPEGTFKFSQMRNYYAGIGYTYEFQLKPKER